MSNLRILTFNTRKSPDIVNVLLNSPKLSTNFDIICLQEPPKDLISHNSWKTLHPSNNTTKKQDRTLVYINNNINSSSYNQIALKSTRDAIAFDLSTEASIIRIINIYNPNGTSWEDSPIHLITPLLELPSNDQLLHISGDFNLHHPMWDPKMSKTIKSTAEDLAELITSSDLQLLLPIGTKTYNLANESESSCIDLVLGNNNTLDHLVQCNPLPELVVKHDDHIPLLTVIQLAPLTKQHIPKYNFSQVLEARLIEFYLSIANPSEAALLDTKKFIDDEISSLIHDIQLTIQNTVPTMRPCNFSMRWWNQEIAILVQKAKQARTYLRSHPTCPIASLRAKNAVKSMRARIKLSKLLYKKKYFESVNRSNLYKKIKSYRNKGGAVSIPPLRKSDNSYATSIHEKVELLKFTFFPTSTEKVITHPNLIEQASTTRLGADYNVNNDDKVNCEAVEALVEVKEKRDEGERKKGGLAKILINKSKNESEEDEVLRDCLQVSNSQLYVNPMVVSTILEVREKNTFETISPSFLHIDSTSSLAIETTLEMGKAVSMAGSNLIDTSDSNDEDLPGTQSQRHFSSMTPVFTQSQFSQFQRQDKQYQKQFRLQRATETSTTSPQPLNPLSSPFIPKKEGESLSKFQSGTYFQKSFISPEASTPVSPTPYTFPSPIPSTSCPKRWTSITDEEAREGIFSANSSSAAGPDKIPNSILKALWPVIGARVSKIYRACSELHYHPDQWKEILAIVLRKPGKDDYSLPKSYRMISLINTLAKGLENCMAKRLSFFAETEGMLSNQHMGGRPGRGTLDAVLYLDAMIHEKWKEGNVVLGVALDVKGAFPSVNKDVLLRNMRRKNVPEEITLWVKSWLEDRTCYFIVEGTTSEKLSANCGLPQGSPISPILYLFYISPLLESLQSANSTCIGYIDDQCTLVWAKTVEEAAQHVRNLIPNIDLWCNEHETEMEGAKSKIILFSKRRSSNLSPIPPIILNGEVIPEVTSITILGAILDTKLSYNEQINRCISKARSALGVISLLSHSTGGLDYVLVRQLVIACVLSTLDYLSPLWYSSKPDHIRTQFTKIQLLCTKLITGGLKQAGSEALDFEAFLQPTEFRLQKNSFRAASKLLTLPPSHLLYPLVVNARSNPSKTHKSAIQHLFDNNPSLALPLRLEMISPTLLPPWEKGIQPRTHIANSKDEAVILHNTITSNAPPSSIFIYSDGSLLENSTGAGVSIYFKERVELEDSLKWLAISLGLGNQQTVYAGELQGINLGLTSILELLESPTFNNNNYNKTTTRIIYLFVDNQSAVLGGFDPFKGAGQYQRNSNRILWKELTSRYPHTSLEICWVPGHVDIEGNERADVAAKDGAEIDFSDVGGELEAYHQDQILEQLGVEGQKNFNFNRSGFLLPKSISATNADFDQVLKQRWDKKWLTVRVRKPGAKSKPTSNRYLKEIDKSTPGLHSLRLHEGLRRRHSSILTQLRTGFGSLNYYLFTTKLSPTPFCDCGQLETRHHYFFSCLNYYHERKDFRRELGQASFDLCSILTDPASITATLRFINNTNRFPRYFQLIEL